VIFKKIISIKNIMLNVFFQAKFATFEK